MRHTQTHTASVYNDGLIKIPVTVTEMQNIGYNDEVSVVLPNLGGDGIVGFTRYATSTLKLTIPTSIRNRYGIEKGDSVAVEMSATGERWEPDEPTGTRGGNRMDVRTL